MNALATWLHSTRLGVASGGGVPWLWPACETLHFVGLALLVGIAGLLDLRMLGVAKGLEIGPLQRLMPWAVGGFALNIITGFIFIAGDPLQYFKNPIFWLKMLFIVLAGVNVILFYVTGLHSKVDSVGAGEDVPLAAKCVAATSLFLWIGVMYWGRMLPFLGNAF